MFRKYKIQFDLDDPRATLEHKRIILSKIFLKKIYIKWYNELIQIIKENPKGKNLEIGSGGGFLKDIFPSIITSDILELPGVDNVINAENLPFESNSLSAILMVNVFHHIPRPYLFLNEAQRCLIPGGSIVMIEPANTFFSRFIYKKFHHEPFEPNGLPEIKFGNPLSNSNQALSYIYFQRDPEKFKVDYPDLIIKKIKYHTPLLYLLSGGVSRAAFVPQFTFSLFKFVEKIISPLNPQISLFNTIVINKRYNGN
jgi:SAM-dependent methyltransferase